MIVEEEIKIHERMLYPNPLGTNSELNVYVPSEKEGHFELQILDTNGRPLFHNAEGRLNEHTSFKPELMKGLYILIINDGKSRHVEKLIVRE
jgi:hypothetical protein